MKKYVAICKPYACYNLCLQLTFAGMALVLLAIVCSFYYGVANNDSSVRMPLQGASCGLKLHDYVATQSYNVMLKTLHAFPAECVRNINKITITSNSALDQTIEVLWR
jgi:hypothetical protein